MRSVTVLNRLQTTVDNPVVRAWLVFLGAVLVGSIAGPLLTDALGVSEVALLDRSTTVRSVAGPVCALAVGLLGGRFLLRAEDPPFLVRIPPAPEQPVTWWPGPRLGAVALVAAPLLLASGEAVRIRHHFYYPAQLAATAAEPGLMVASYSLYAAGLLLLVPAFLALTQLIGRQLPGWAFWGATLAVIGHVVRVFHEGVNHLAMHLVAAQGLDAATDGVAATYQSWYVLYPLTFADNLCWPILAIGAYRARVLGWVPALGLAAMHVHSSGVLKGSDLGGLTLAAVLCVALVPLGVAMWRDAPRMARRTRLGCWAAVAAIALLYAYHLLFVLPVTR